MLMVTPAPRRPWKVVLQPPEPAQSGGIFRAVLAGLAHPDAPLAAPRLAELHKPNQGLICVAYGGFVSSPGLSPSLS